MVMILVVAKDQTKSVARALPVTSVTPPAVPFTLAVYVTVRPKGAVGVRTAVKVELLYETVAGTRLLAESRKVNVFVSTVAGFKASLKVTLTDEAQFTAAAPFVG